MKKVLLALALLGLVAGIAQTQNVQVRKVFAHHISNYVSSFAIDTLGGKYVVVADLIEGDGGAKSRIAVFDSSGERLSLEGGGGHFPFWIRRTSKTGRYFAVRQQGGVWKGMDKRGNLVPNFPQYFHEILMVSDDGSRWLGLRRYYRSPGSTKPSKVRGPNVEYDISDTLVLFDWDGRQLATIPAPGLTYACFSPIRNWLFIRYTNFNTKKRALVCFDTEGRQNWYKEGSSSPCFQADSSNNLCVFEFRRDKGYGLAFYAPDGLEKTFVPVIDPSENVNYYACSLELTKDGNFAVLNGDKQGLFFVQKSPSKIMWNWKRNLTPLEQHLINDIAISDLGDYVVAEIRSVNQSHGPICLFNKKGEIVWTNSVSQGAIAHLSFGLNNHFAAHTGNSEVTLFEIKP